MAVKLGLLAFHQQSMSLEEGQDTGKVSRAQGGRAWPRLQFHLWEKGKQASAAGSLGQGGPWEARAVGTLAVGPSFCLRTPQVTPASSVLPVHWPAEPTWVLEEAVSSPPSCAQPGLEPMPSAPCSRGWAPFPFCPFLCVLGRSQPATCPHHGHLVPHHCHLTPIGMTNGGLHAEPSWGVTASCV